MFSLARKGALGKGKGISDMPLCSSRQSVDVLLCVSQATALESRLDCLDSVLDPRELVQPSYPADNRLVDYVISA